MVENSPRIQKCLSETFVQKEREEKQRRDEDAWQKEERRSEEEEGRREEEGGKTERRNEEEERREEEEMRDEGKEIKKIKHDEARRKGSMTTMTGKRRKSRVVSCTINMTLEGFDSCKRNLNEMEAMKEERESSKLEF